MGRRLRHYLPGMPFHLTARIQGREPLFYGLERPASEAILHASRRSDVRLLAWAIMPNHMHVVVIQGNQPLGAFMLPLMRRLAWLVSRHHSRDGHVFERRYHSEPCMDGYHLRNAIVYTHLNPVRAHFCASADESTSTSHLWYTRGVAIADSPGNDGQVPPELELRAGLRLFAGPDAHDVNSQVAGYRNFVEWRVEADAARTLGVPIPPPPPCSGGDQFWNTHVLRWTRHSGRSVPADLRRLAEIVLNEHAPQTTLDELRSGGRTRSLVKLRRLFITRARQDGHTGVRIAAFLGVSSTTVSRTCLPICVVAAFRAVIHMLPW
ncbi:MAG TPA: transposase [Longimicrobiales bacterium]|nr:transposase [Longimicrobiales bacterium]